MILKKLVFSTKQYRNHNLFLKKSNHLDSVKNFHFLFKVISNIFEVSNSDIKLKKIIFALSLFFFSCVEKETISTSYSSEIIGKWNPTYLQQTKDKDGMWGPWGQINTFVALPQYEFTAQNKFLTNGKPGAGCCFAGNVFSIDNNTILFSDMVACDPLPCNNCSNWSIVQIKNDTLVLEQCTVRVKMAKTK